MKKIRLTSTLIFLLAANLAFAQRITSQTIQSYIEKYRDLAIAEMKRSGVPASITLAQGILETEAGNSPLVVASNNHFGIKCKSTWTGESVRHDDDARGECFRKYPTAEESFKDHSDFLRAGARYAFLFQLDPTDYESWANGLKKAGYATNPKYPQILIKYIREYQLQDYTLIAMGRKQPAHEPYLVKNNTAHTTSTNAQPAVAIEIKMPVYPEGVFSINETDVVYVPKGTSFLSIAEQYRVRLPRIFDFNDMAPQDVTSDDQLVYLQRKRKTGNHEFHTVAEGENLYQIAQMEGIRFESLLAYNYLKFDMQPQVGEVLHLHRKAPSMPRLVTASTVASLVPDHSNENSSNFTPSEPLPGNTTSTAITAVNFAALNATAEEFILHIVQPKETMYSISKKYSVKMEDVLKWNDLPGTTLKTGQQLRIKKM